MASVHVYFDISKLPPHLKLQGRSGEGLHYLNLGEENGPEIKCNLSLENNGFFYIHGDVLTMRIPEVLNSFVTEVTTKDHLYSGGKQISHVVCGHYGPTTNLTAVRAEVVEEILSGKLGRVVIVAATKLSTLREYRKLLLAGKLTPKHSYESP